MEVVGVLVEVVDVRVVVVEVVVVEVVVVVVVVQRGRVQFWLMTKGGVHLAPPKNGCDTIVRVRVRVPTPQMPATAERGSVSDGTTSTEYAVLTYLGMDRTRSMGSRRTQEVRSSWLED